MAWFKARPFWVAVRTLRGLAWVVIVGYEGNADAVNWQVQQLVKEVGTHDRLDARVGFTAERLWAALVEWGAWPAARRTS